MARKATVLQGVKGASADKPAETGLISVLEGIASDTDQPAAARTAAARAVLEARGVLGRHAPPPGSELARVPLSDCTRPQLEAELSRLRAAIAARQEDKA